MIYFLCDGTLTVMRTPKTPCDSPISTKCSWEYACVCVSASPGRRHGALLSVWNLSSTHLQVLLREQCYWTLLGSKRELPMRISTYNSGHRWTSTFLGATDLFFVYLECSNTWNVHKEVMLFWVMFQFHVDVQAGPRPDVETERKVKRLARVVFLQHSVFHSPLSAQGSWRAYVRRALPVTLHPVCHEWNFPLNCSVWCLKHGVCRFFLQQQIIVKLVPLLYDTFPFAMLVWLWREQQNTCDGPHQHYLFLGICMCLC